MTIFVESGHVNEYPFNHARIIYGNASNVAVTATGANTEYPAALVLTETTYERWKPLTSGDSITLTFDAGNYNAVALAALSDLNFTLEVRQVGSPVFETIKMFRPDDGETLSADFTEPDYGLLDYSPDNQAIMVLLKKRQLNAIRITVTYDGTAPTLGVIRVGNVLEMARPFYQGHNPAMLSSNSTVRPNVSDSGEWLGASLVRQSRSLSMAWNNLKADWVRKNWVPFSQTLKTKPFFIAWNPLRFPTDCFYATATQTPKPTNSGPRDYQSITLAATAYSDGSDPVVESLGSKTFSELFTFSRDSDGTYYDVNGVLQTATTDEPRFTYDPVTNAAEGLLIEEARSNGFTNTNMIDNSAVWAALNLSVYPNVAVSPDSKLNAEHLVTDTTSANHATYQATPLTAGQAYTFSVFVKAAGYDKMRLSLLAGSFGSNYSRNFDLTLGTSGATGQSVPDNFGIVDVGNGWYQCFVTATATATSGASYNVRMYLLDNAGSTTFAGDGESGIYAYGMQIEAGAFPTSYIPSTETFTSRASTAQYIDGNGDWQLAAVNEERANAYGYDSSGNLEFIGQLLEPARTNLCTQPRQLDGAAWTNSDSIILPNAAIAPNAALQAGKFTTANVVSTNMRVFDPFSVVSGTTYTFSIYAKAAELDTIQLRLLSSGFGVSIVEVFNVATGQRETASLFAESASIVPAGNGWYRCSITATATVTGTSSFLIYANTNTGDGTSGFYLWGAQVEAGAYPTSLTPDATTFTSRAGSASYYDSNGIMQTAGTNVERSGAIAYGYDPAGVLVATDGVYEPAATNDWIYSENLFLSGIGKTRAFIVPNQELGQTGGISASKLVSDGTASSSHYATEALAFSAASVYTFSVYAKADEFTTFALDLPSAQFGSVQRALFDLTDGTVSFPSGNNLTHYGSQLVGDGWWRIWITSTCTSSGTGAAILLLYDNTGQSVFDGDYESGVYLWGVQVETGSFPSSYIFEGTTWSSRASTATYYDSDGIIQTASSGVARDAAYYPKDGVFYPIGRTLIEAASTNLITYSEALDNAAWGKARVTITANSTTSPDGNVTADKIVLDSTNNTHAVTQAISFTSGVIYTFSVYAKAAELPTVLVAFGASAFGSVTGRRFNLSDGSTSSPVGTFVDADSWGIESIGNGFYRCWVTATAAASVTDNAVVYLINSDGDRTFLGDGTSGVYLWGAQVESYSPASYTAYYATSYIPTTSSTVTRAADSFTSGAVTRAADVTSSPSVTRSADVYTSTALSRAADLCTRTPGIEFNKTAFTIYVEAAYSDDAIEIFFDANSGATDNDANRISLYRSNSTNTFVGYIKDDAGTSASRSISGTDGAGTAKVALSFDGSTGAFIAAANGTSSSTTTTITEINPTRFIVGDRFDLTQYNLNDAIKNLKIYPTALTATELEAITE